MSILESAEHIIWSIEKSPQAYRECRDILTNLRICIVNAELREREEENVANA